MVQATTKGTVKDNPNFKVQEDVAALRKAIEGLGTTEKTLVEVLTQRTNAQRQLIAQAYEKATGRTLVDDLKGDTGGDFESVLVALVTPPAVYDSQEVLKAIKGPGTTETTLTEIFASRSNKQIKALSEAYLASDTFLRCGGFIRIFLCFVVKSMKTLYDAGEKKWGTDEAKFIDILCHGSVPQLRQMFVEYKGISKKTLQESIESEMNGDLEELLVAVVKCVKSVPAFFAERLFKSMKGTGTTESTLTRIIVSRSEVDLMDIRAEYKKIFGHTLYSQLETEVGGSYGDVIKRLCGQD
uniref:Annexin n=1 Tax=Neogobius melanostomus TaxID=47308 RepID=A0A8C6SU45_9GOBI